MTPDDPFALERFVDAQAPVYDRACRELRAGTKQSHWIWYIFPQLRGLGRSATATKYGIADADEARAYLAHPILGARLIACTDLMLAIDGKTLGQVMPFPDDLKFISSMTLFAEIAPDPEPFRAALAKFANGQRDATTLHLLRRA